MLNKMVMFIGTGTKVWRGKQCMYRYITIGPPTWWVVSGRRVMKSQNMSGSCGEIQGKEIIQAGEWE